MKRSFVSLFVTNLVRTRGLWGSVWSRKGRTSSPGFVPTLLKSIFLWLFIAPFIPRRKVTGGFGTSNPAWAVAWA